MNFPTQIMNVVKKIKINPPDYQRVFYNWSQIVGGHYSKLCSPYKVSNLNGGKILILKVEKGCSMEILHETGKILSLIHKFLGQKVFIHIKVIQID
ncbi:MAG: DUF721 domain-containing protein [Holosporaceae bacterium]|jgi:hypothetical protein|nr:DUF721 domain-containing protein [Holosporaceae bacterium]